MIYNGHDGYLDDIAKTVSVATERLRPFRKHFQVIAVSGMSGVLVGSPVAIRLRRELVVIRKPSDSDNHSSEDIINGQAVKVSTPYLFLDDFISLGSTFNRVRERMEYSEDTRAVYAGSYLYAQHTLSLAEEREEPPRIELSPSIFSAVMLSPMSSLACAWDGS